MTYARIEAIADLPPEGPLNARAREKSDLDFKTFTDPAKMWEHSKDVAAFANALGGVLLIGADDRTGQLVYPGIAGQTVKDVQGIYEAAAQLCSPAPVVDVVPIPEKNIVAVNVDPYVDQLVGAPASTRDKNGVERKHDAAWSFPMRRASQTEWIKPENLAMYMNRDVRRAVLLLARIPDEEKNSVQVACHKIPAGDNPLHPVRPKVEEWELSIGEISIERNFLALVKHTGSATCTCNVPLTDILNVWQAETGRWRLLLHGGLVETATEHRTGNLDYVVNSRI